MVATIVFIIIYFSFIFFGWKQTVKLRDYLLTKQAISPDTAILINKDNYFLLTIKFPFSAIIEEDDGAIWFNKKKWKLMVGTFGVLIFITFLTLSLIII